MRVIKSSGFRKISQGLTVVLVAKLIYIAVIVAVALFSETEPVITSVSDILLGGGRFLAWLLILAELTECAKENRYLQRARLTVVIYLVMAGICIGLDSLSLYLLDIDSENDIFTIIISTIDFVTSATVFIAVLDVVRGFGQAWYDCGGDEETAGRIVSARRRYSVSMTACILNAAVLCVMLVLVYIKAPNLSHETAVGLWVAVLICGFASVPLEIWNIVDFYRIVRLCRRVVRTIDEISGG